MARHSWIVAAILFGGCLQTGDAGFGNSSDDDGTVLPDGDADVDGDSDGDVPEIPAYPDPEGGYGMREGDIVPDMSFPGNAPGDETWSMSDFWEMAHSGDAPSTVLILDVHSMTCGICLGQAAPELQVWQDQFGSRGLVPFGVSIFETQDAARGYWEGELGHTHPWAADQGFSTAQFFDGSTIGTPAYIVVDLNTMEILHEQQGFSGQEQTLFEGLLRSE